MLADATTSYSANTIHSVVSSLHLVVADTTTAVPVVGIEGDATALEISKLVPPLGTSNPAPDTVVSSTSSSSWRQYVPLVVSAGVLLDIVLGSPAANSVLRLAQPPTDPNNDDAQSRSNLENKPSKERIDTMAVAQQALDKASATTELRRYLDENQSDWQKIQKIQQEMDQQLADYDSSNQKQQNE